VQTFDPKTIEGTRDSASASPVWDSAQLGFGVPMGGNVMMIYDSDDRPTEMQVRSADGQLVTRIVRTYDAQGRLTGEKPLEQNLGLLIFDRMPPEKRASLSPDQIQAIQEWKGLNALGTEAGRTFAYDAKGRITQTRERDLIGEKKTTILYNEQGNKAHERTTFKKNPEIPTGVPLDSDLRYAYQYDSYGNWTERTETRAEGSSEYTRRMLTYY